MHEQALEEVPRRHGAADAIGVFCAGAKFDFQEHVPSFITASIPSPSLALRTMQLDAVTERGSFMGDFVGSCHAMVCCSIVRPSPCLKTVVTDVEQALVPLLVEPGEATLLACWEALGTVTGTIPKDLLPSYVPVLKEAVATAREKVRCLLPCVLPVIRPLRVDCVRPFPCSIAVSVGAAWQGQNIRIHRRAAAVLSRQCESHIRAGLSKLRCLRRSGASGCLGRFRWRVSACPRGSHPCCPSTSKASFGRAPWTHATPFTQRPLSSALNCAS